MPDIMLKYFIYTLLIESSKQFYKSKYFGEILEVINLLRNRKLVLESRSLVPNAPSYPLPSTHCVLAV